MPEPITLATLAVNVGCGIAGNALQTGGVGGYKKIAKILAKGTAAENHDILKATHTAYVAAMNVMTRCAVKVAGSDEEIAGAKALKKLCGDKSFSGFRYDGEHFPLAAVNKAIDQMFARALDEPGPEVGEEAFNQVVVRDLAAWGVALPPLLETLFVNGVADCQPWDVVFRASFAEQVKSNQAAFRILTFERLGELRAIGLALTDEIASLQDRFDRIDRDNEVTREMLAKLEARISEQAGVPLATMAAVAQAFGEFQPNADAATIESYLRAKADEYHRYRERAEAIEERDNYSRILLSRAQAAIDKGLFDEADRLIAEAEEHDEEISGELRLTADQRDQDRSAKRVLRGYAARLAGDYAQAIAHYDKAADILPASAGFECTKIRSTAAEAAAEWGEWLGFPQALPDAVARWQKLLAETDRGRDEDQWADLNSMLGNALVGIAEREEEESGALQSGIEAYNAALDACSKEHSPERWAGLMNNLGNALRIKGMRGEGFESLEQSVAAFEAALEVETDESMRAVLNSNLGSSLMMLGQRKKRTAEIAAAITAFSTSLKLATRDLDPLSWSATMVNFATALTLLGGATDDSNKLREAVTAIEAALQVRTRERMPLQWSDAQSNLGIAYTEIGRIDGDEEALAAAVNAFRASLEIYTGPHLRLDWALTAENLAQALVVLGASREDCHTVEEAIDIYKEVVGVFDHASRAWNRAKAERGLAEATIWRNHLCGNR